MNQPGFIFGGDTGTSYEQLQRQRKIADSLRAANSRTPRNVGEGIHAITRALVAKSWDKQNDRQEQTMRDDLNSSLEGIFGGWGGGASGDYGSAGTYTPPSPWGEMFPAGREVDPNAPQNPRMATKMPATPDMPAGSLDIGTTDPWAGKEDIKAGIFAGESGGDYDAVFGYQNRPGGKFAGVKPTDMTVGEVLQFQDPQGEYGQWVKGQVGRVATPVGAYQVVGTTLRDAVKAGVVDPNARFDQATQDKVGEWVLSTQGTGAWEGYRGPQSGGGQQRGQGVRTAQAGGLTPEVMKMIQVMNNPMLPAGQRQVLGALLQQRMQGNDPMRQLDMEYKRAQLDQIRNPQKDPPKVEEINGVAATWDAQRGQYVPVEGFGNKNKPDAEGESKLRKEFQGLAPVKAFQEQAGAMGRIVASAENPSPAGDLAMVFNFMKVLDPGSVVRESEFATAEGATRWLQESEEAGMVMPRPIASAIRKLATGERLSNSQRQDFVDRAAAIYRQSESQFNTLAEQYDITANDYGYDAGRTIPDSRYRPEGRVPSREFSPRPQARTGSVQPDTDQPEQSGGMTFETFAQDPSAQAAAERYGVTLEEMWEIKRGAK